MSKISYLMVITAILSTYPLIGDETAVSTEGKKKIEAELVNQEITRLNFSDIRAEVVFQFLSRGTKINFELKMDGLAKDRTVDCDFKDISLLEALKVICKQCDYEFTVKDDRVEIVPKNLQKDGFIIEDIQVAKQRYEGSEPSFDALIDWVKKNDSMFDNSQDEPVGFGDEEDDPDELSFKSKEYQEDRSHNKVEITVTMRGKQVEYTDVVITGKKSFVDKVRALIKEKE